MALGPQFKQGTLFSTRGMRRRGPGEMGPDAWAARSDIVHHGTFREDWEGAPLVHVGTIGAAQERTDQLSRSVNHESMARNYLHPDWAAADEWDDEPPEVPDTLVGKVHPRRLSNVASMKQPLSDADVNAVHKQWVETDGDAAPRSVHDSARESRLGWSEREALAQHFDRGLALPYKNEGEDVGSTSFVTPTHNLHSWESDVVNSRFASPLAQQFARDRLQQGKELQSPVLGGPEGVDAWDGAEQPVLYNGSRQFNPYDKRLLMRKTRQMQHDVTVKRGV